MLLGFPMTVSYGNVPQWWQQSEHCEALHLNYCLWRGPGGCPCTWAPGNDCTAMGPGIQYKLSPRNASFYIYICTLAPLGRDCSTAVTWRRCYFCHLGSALARLQSQCSVQASALQDIDVLGWVLKRITEMIRGIDMILMWKDGTV